MSIEYDDKIIVHFLEKPQDPYFDAENWPLHATLMPWFHVDGFRDVELGDGLGIIAHKTELITATTGQEALFGRKHNIRVRLIGSKALLPLHYKLANLIEAPHGLRGVVRETDFYRRDYQPHITEPKYSSIPPGQELKIDNFSVVRLVDTPKGNREIIKTYEFEG